MEKIINFALIKQPMNWLIVMSMVLIASVAMSYIMKYQTSE